MNTNTIKICIKHSPKYVLLYVNRHKLTFRGLAIAGFSLLGLQKVLLNQIHFNFDLHYHSSFWVLWKETFIQRTPIFLASLSPSAGKSHTRNPNKEKKCFCLNVTVQVCMELSWKTCETKQIWSLPFFFSST